MWCAFGPTAADRGLETFTEGDRRCGSEQKGGQPPTSLLLAPRAGKKVLARITSGGQWPDWPFHLSPRRKSSKGQTDTACVLSDCPLNPSLRTPTRESCVNPPRDSLTTIARRMQKGVRRVLGFLSESDPGQRSGRRRTVCPPVAAHLAATKNRTRRLRDR